MFELRFDNYCRKSWFLPLDKEDTWIITKFFKNKKVLFDGDINLIYEHEYEVLKTCTSHGKLNMVYDLNIFSLLKTFPLSFIRIYM